MPVIKPKRKGPVMDMTAMCDVAFLLLSFFIMTTQFKGQESVTIDTPSSISQTKIPDRDVATISIDPDGKYYFGVTNPKDRGQLFQRMAAKYGVAVNNGDLKSFEKLSDFGISIAGLKQYLNLSPEDQLNVKMAGIPNDSTKSELGDWVTTYLKEVNPSAKLAIRGDATTRYPAIKQVLNELGKRDINKFQLITGVEGNPN
ncbi:biopolymer transporter ExbD [Emticicia sp.]|uniref:biopolymer transporter ExbD n=1 Tax=Emticicia sp. TaxID=1930953 RepID=UPI003753833E